MINNSKVLLLGTRFFFGERGDSSVIRQDNTKESVKQDFS